MEREVKSADTAPNWWVVAPPKVRCDCQAKNESPWHRCYPWWI